MTAIHFSIIKNYSNSNKNIDAASISFYLTTLSIPVLFFIIQFEEKPAFSLLSRD